LFGQEAEMRNNKVPKTSLPMENQFYYKINADASLANSHFALRDSKLPTLLDPLAYRQAPMLLMVVFSSANLCLSKHTVFYIYPPQ
jgi:hypothetical protein